MSDYVELHCHSAFSLLDGASLPEMLVMRAHELGLHALALTDHDDLGGIVSFAQAARSAGVEAIVGGEVTVAGNGTRDAGSGMRERPRGRGSPYTSWSLPASRLPRPAPPAHLILLAESPDGYANLSTLITRARMDSPRGTPSVSLDVLAQHARGLFALTGCPRGWVPARIAQGDIAGARHAAGTLLDIFEGRVAIECWDHRLPEERELVTRLIALARSLDVSWVVTNDVHYATPDERIVHDMLSALRHGKTLDEMGTRLRPNAEWCLKSARQMMRRWRAHPEGVRATVEIAERCRFRLLDDLEPTLPAYPLPPGTTADEHLARLVEEGARKRWGVEGAQRPDRRMQLAHELAMIKRLGLAGYFLIVWDIVRFARDEGILCQGRGSAANSAVCFCLGITPVDPIKLGLLFERFLSNERQEAPDIDIDFAHRERERVIQYVYERYGREHAAMVCEQITYRGKSATRDVERVLVREAGSAVLRDATGSSPDALSPEVVPASRVPLPASRLTRLPRHRSIHVGGFVLTEQPLSSVVPVEPASMEHRTVIQWDKDDVDAVGLVKIDLLGLGMLTLIQDCLQSIRETRGQTIDLAQLDYADPAVYDDMCRADTIGVFQIESRAQMQTLPRLKPRCFYDLVVEVALIRPGPIQGEMVHPYLRRRNGEESVKYLHPSLEPILARTLGVPLFQEQGMQVAIAAAGFTPGEADTLRRAMGHKRSRERMAALRERLLHGMMQNGIAEADAERIYKQLNGFADYGFPESHAASFASLVYASAYLKHYYAPEFTAAILNAQPMGFYAPGTLIEDARRHGVTVLPVDVTRSAWDSTVELRAAEPRNGGRREEKGERRNGSDLLHLQVTELPGCAGSSLLSPFSSLAVRLGLRLVRGLGRRAREQLERALRDGRPFHSIGDVVMRSGLDRRSLRALAESGALDAFVPGEPTARRRRVAVWRMLEEFRGDAGPLAPSRPRPSVPPHLPALAPLELTAVDYRLTGVSLNGHPMTHLRPLFAPSGVKTAREILAMPDGTRNVAVAGLVICRQQPHTAKGFVFLSLEDETGIVNVVVTPKRFARQSALIAHERLLLVRGTLQVERGVVNLRGEDFRALKTEAGEAWGRGHDFH